MATETATAEQPAPPKEESSSALRDQLADRIIRENVLWAAGGGLVPVPIFDVLAIALVQVKMLKELAGVYNVAFQEDRAKTILISLATGIGAPVVGAAIGVSAVKFVPVLGYFIGAAAVPGVAAAFTYAVGKVFHQHFASGGTFLNFDPKKVRTYFARQFQEGKSVAAKIKSDSPQEVETPVKSA